MMNSLKLNKLAVLEAMGLTAIAVLAMPNLTQAATVVKGSDYWITRAGSSFNFGGNIGQVDFVGVPINTFTPPDSSTPINVGKADTIVRRLNDVTFSDPNNSNESGRSNVEVVALSLKSKNPVNINGSSFEILVSLDPNQKSTGTININEDKTFYSDFTVHWIPTFKPVGGGDPIACPLTPCNFPIHLGGNGNWSTEFQGGTKVKGLVGDMNANVHTNLASDQVDFFVVGTIEHDASGAGHHNVAATPEPFTILGAATAVGFGALFKRKLSKKVNH